MSTLRRKCGFRATKRMNLLRLRKYHLIEKFRSVNEFPLYFGRSTNDTYYRQLYYWLDELCLCQACPCEMIIRKFTPFDLLYSGWNHWLCKQYHTLLSFYGFFPPKDHVKEVKKKNHKNAGLNGVTGRLVGPSPTHFPLGAGFFRSQDRFRLTEKV